MVHKLLSNKFSQVLHMSAGPASPAPRLLRSNAPPTDEERVAIQRSIRAAQEKRAILKRALAFDVNALSFWRLATVKLTRRRIHTLDNFIGRHEARVTSSGILFFPTELLLIIFEMVVREDEESFVTENGKLKPDFYAPCILSHVCQHWRNAMLSFPRMWSRPLLVCLDRKFSYRKPYLHFLAEVLQRSHPRPITLSVYDYRQDLDISTRKLHHPALEILLQHSERWEMLILSINSLKTLQKFSLAKGKLSSLRSFNIKGSFSRVPSSLPPNAPPCDIFDSPSLKYVDLGSNHCNITFSGITYFTLCLENETNSIRDLQLITSCSTSIEHLTLHLDYAASMPTRTSMPRLKSLTIKFTGSSTSEFLDNIIAPSLESLMLETVTNGSGDLSIPVLDLLRRSRAKNVYRLHLKQARAPLNLTSVLEQTLFLRYLKVTLPHSSDIDALAQRQRLPLVPFLEHCEFVLYQQIPADVVEPLHNLAMARCDTRMPLNNALTYPNGPVITEVGLDGFYLLCTSLHHIISTQIALEGWKGSNMTDRLRTLSNVLNQLPSNLSTVIRSEGEGLRRQKNIEVLKTLLPYILETDISAVDMFMSGMLRTIALHVKKKDSLFQDIARRILSKWAPIVDEYLNTRRWKPCGSNSLLYVKDENRSSVPLTS